jgi:hypothetical protein
MLKIIGYFLRMNNRLFPGLKLAPLSWAFVPVKIHNYLFVYENDRFR